MDPVNTLPTFVEGEKAVLAGLILDNSKLPEVVGCLKTQDFYLDTHRQIFTAIVRCFKHNLPCDPAIIATRVPAESVSALMDLVDHVPSAANIMAYVDLVKEKSSLRATIRANAKIEQKLYSGLPFEEIRQDVLKMTYDFMSANRSAKSRSYSMAEACAGVLDSLSKKTTMAGVLQTPFPGLNQYTGGIFPGYTIIAAETSVGKTALALQLADFFSEDHRGIYGSFEMPADQLTMRTISRKACINLLKLRCNNLNPEELARVVEAVGPLSERKLRMVGLEANTVPGLRMEIQKEELLTGEKVEFVVVDYVQKMDAQLSSGANENDCLTAISTGLQRISLEYNIPVIVLSQLRRKGEDSRTKKVRKPRRADLRGSGSLEQDADTIIFLHDGLDEETRQLYSDVPLDKEIIIGKQRNGPLATIPVKFQGQLGMFYQESVNV
jgi:replicative DNA helicase